MERKFRKIATGLFLSAMALGCGYFEKDGIAEENQIAKNISVERQENGDTWNIVFTEGNEVGAVVIERCKAIYIDAGNGIMYAESGINSGNSAYFQMDFLDLSSHSVSKALKKKRLDSTEYFSKTKGLKKVF